MDKLKAKKEIQKLSKELGEHNYRYYMLSQPIISDKEFDDLLKRLIKLEKDYPELKDANSPTQRVGVKMPSGAQTVRHKVKMYSLDNTYSIDELQEWHKRVQKGLPGEKVEFFVELKIDGVSAALTFQNGHLVLGATRGDGLTGEDVTHNLKTIRTIPLKLIEYKKYSIPKLLEVRGEIYMALKDFEKMNKQQKKLGETIFANPRNATSGSIKLLDSRITAKRHLNFFVHSFGNLEGGAGFKTHDEFLDCLHHWGFCVNQHNRICKSMKDVVDYCHEFQNKRNALPYEVDGVVIKVNNIDQRNVLGATLKSPRWAVAYKFPAHQATTIVKDIIVQVGRTGVLTPVAELKPVECAGVTISRSTLHNFDEIKRLGVKKGDRVLIERAGDVIPKVIKVVESNKKSKGKPVEIPKKCPECKGPVVKEKSDLVAYRCNNPSCPRKMEKGLIHFASRTAMDIEGLGSSVVEQLLKNQLVKDLADIYFLKKEDLLKLELFAEKKAENLLAAIKKSKKQPLSRLLFALGITNVGEKAAYVLARRYGTLDQLMKAGSDELAQIREIGQVISDSVVNYFKQSSTQKMINKLKEASLNFEEPEPQNLSQLLLNKRIVFTGELDGLSRSQASSIVKKLGGEVVASVSKLTDFVVVGDSPGSKYEKAKNLGVRVLNEKQFREMVNE